MNDPLALEAAERLARRMLRESERGVSERAARLFQLCLTRPPTQQEVARLSSLYEETKQKLEQDREAASALLNVNRIVYHSDRTVTVLPDSRNEAVEWRYEVKEPPDAWTGADFDDSSWQRGNGLFGLIKSKRRTPRPDEDEDESDYRRLEPRTVWNSEKIWMRREFVVDGPGFEGFRVWARFRGSFQLWINGIQAANSGDEVSGPVEMKISAEAEKAIRPGRNIVSVLAQRTVEGDGDQYVDVSLTALRPPAYEPAQAGDAERAAWVTVAHVLLNLDETFTKR
jgi:hypothetical protein